MTDTPETNFINDYEPGPDATVELKNAKIVDVENGSYYDPGMSIVLDKFGGLGKLKGIDAVRIGTINSAKSVGMDKDFGTIEPGKTGDLAIIDGDPLEDASLVGGRVAALFKDGKLVINNCGLEVKKGA